MPIVVDTTRAPQFLVYRFSELPSTKERSSLHGSLVSMGVLTADTVALMDARELVPAPGDEMPATSVFTALHHDGWPRRRAYLFNADMHRHMLQQFHDLAMTTVTTAAFADEAEALKWLGHS